ncbi:MAG TPA: PilX N-terminal domain-containing pilus assembly protein [Burkholderiaceae bacterium]|nr:PilX N-terminal domain-containing pilus assembly protein [Burkholderiaceae bacterium]
MNHDLLFHASSARRQRGAAALLITLLLLVAMALAALFVNRNLVFEQRAAANQYRSTQAFEAAEAGLEWALAQLNRNDRLGPDCQPTNDPTATSFRTHYLAYNPADASFTPLTWLHGGVPTALQPSCVRSATSWDCSCPTQGSPVLPAIQTTGPAPAFTLQFLPGDKPGTVRVASIGCTSLAGECLAGATTPADASAHVEAAFGLLAALRTPPAAALTVRGTVDAGTAALGAHNPDPATGLAIHAGGAVLAAQVRLSGPAGSSLAGTVIGNDTTLAQLSPDRFFASHFGLDKTAWKSQATVTRIQCPSDCGAALTQAIGDAGANPMIWVDGDLPLTGPLSLGSGQHPALIVVAGVTRLDGAVAMHGVLYTGDLVWNGAGAVLRGAALSEGGYLGNASAELFYDTAVLATLNGNTGSFARINGSWRDF